MTQHSAPANAADTVRDLARHGTLVAHFTSQPADARRALRAGAFELVWPLVYHRITRRYEYQRGHHACATSIQRMEPDCIDRFHDDVDAVLDDLFHHAAIPIHNLEGWLTRRLRASTVDGHRRRRGARGAMQKPRLPAWLATALHHDPWLTDLAVEMLIWVGVDSSAGTQVWPVDAWTERRIRHSAAPANAEHAVTTQIDTVLRAMRIRPTWYSKYIERPLGRKRPPVITQPAGVDQPQRPLSLTTRGDRDDARLAELAAVAIAAIEHRIGRGEDPHTVVTQVINQTFVGGTGIETFDEAPGQSTDRIEALVTDPRVIDRIYTTVIAVVRAGQRHGETAAR